MIRAAIDLGTNTCLLLVVEWDESRGMISKVLGDYATVVRLGEGLDLQRTLQPPAITRTLTCLREYSERVISAGGRPEATICVGTSQARDAKNSADFFSRVKRETGFNFRILSGDEEARYTFRGALPPEISSDTAWVLDIGGGSTELIGAAGEKSIDVGSVRFTERHLKSDPVTPAELTHCQSLIEQALVSFDFAKTYRRAHPEGFNLVAVAGTATTLAAWHLGLPHFDPVAVGSVILTRELLETMVLRLRALSAAERRKLPGMDPLRADVILGGALILLSTLRYLEVDACRVSTRGLRYGVMALDP
jgi:exopolyphosphatase/guanosine-5'-triphosphate,3'-diphosphate pyrophosphatase